MGLFSDLFTTGPRVSDYLPCVPGMPDVGQGTGWAAHRWRRAPVEKVYLDQLTGTQSYLSQSRLRHYATGRTHSGGLRVCVVAHQGRYYVAEGHHRVVAAMLRGERYIRAHVIRAGGGSR